MSKVAELKELNEMLVHGLINQEEHDRLRTHLLRIGRPLGNEISFRDPYDGTVVTLRKTSVFWMTLFFGFFYLAYHRAWSHAVIAFVLALFTFGLSWLIYPFFAYRAIMDNYRHNGWIEVSMPASKTGNTGLVIWAVVIGFGFLFVIAGMAHH